MDGKRKHMFDDSENEDEFEAESKKSVPKHIRKQEKRLIIILENAHLETIKVTLYWICNVGFQLSGLKQEKYFLL